MINRRLSIILIILGILLLICTTTGCSPEKDTKLVQAEENFSTDDLTLLERTFDDTDGDGDKETIKLYTSAQIASDGQMLATDHQWVLLVIKDGAIFPLFNDHLQLGELQFWVASLDNDETEGSESTELQCHIYVTVTTDVSFKLLDFYWDEQNHCYKEEVILDSPGQRIMSYSNKYKISAPDNIDYDYDYDHDYDYDYDATDPTEVARADYMSWLKEDYTISMNVLYAEVDYAETQRMIERYKGSELAESRGWTDAYLDEHFIVVKVIYECEIDHTKTFLRDGLLESYSLLTRQPESGIWVVKDRTSPGDMQ